MKTRWAQRLFLLQITILAHGALAADFSGADLRGAHLKNANLRGSNLDGANLTDANLSGADLRDTNVTQRQLDSACGSGTKLPSGLGILPCSATIITGRDIKALEQQPIVDQARPEADDGREASPG